VASLGLTSGAALAHDIYSTLPQRDKNGEPTGTLCCGGTDCEAVSYEINPDGSAYFMPTKNVQGRVLVPRDKITWMAVPGGEYSEAHWCGRKRHVGSAWGSSDDPAPGGDQPDETFWTYCAFIAPGGV